MHLNNYSNWNILLNLPLMDLWHFIIKESYHRAFKYCINLIFKYIYQRCHMQQSKHTCHHVVHTLKGAFNVCYEWENEKNLQKCNHFQTLLQGYAKDYNVCMMSLQYTIVSHSKLYYGFPAQRLVLQYIHIP